MSLPGVTISSRPLCHRVSSAPRRTSPMESVRSTATARGLGGSSVRGRVGANASRQRLTATGVWLRRRGSMAAAGAGRAVISLHERFEGIRVGVVLHIGPTGAGRRQPAASNTERNALRASRWSARISQSRSADGNGSLVPSRRARAPMHQVLESVADIRRHEAVSPGAARARPSRPA